MTRRAVALTFCLVLVVGFSVAADPVFLQENVASKSANEQVATWDAKFLLDNELYPSYVLAMEGPVRDQGTAHCDGDPQGLARVLIRPTIPNAKVHVEIQIEGLTRPSAMDVTLAEGGKQYCIAPSLHYDFPRLAKIEQSIPATVVYKVRVNGIDTGEKTLSIRVRSVNDVPYLIVAANGTRQDHARLFAAYVNESHPFVESVLQEALRWRAVNAFDGYQRNPQDVQLQVFAIWNVLQRHHLHYSSVTTPSAASPSGRVYSQAVRFIDQSVRSQQANCVDGSVLFASILYKIGIYPILVLKPGHMFVGYYMDKNRSKTEFLETTMLGAGDQPGALNQPFSSLHPVQTSKSWREFVKAVQYANQTYSREVAPAIRQSRPGYRLIDVAKARQAGINAIPHTGA